MCRDISFSLKLYLDISGVIFSVEFKFDDSLIQIRFRA